METNHFALDAEDAELILFAFDEDLDTKIDALPFGAQRSTSGGGTGRQAVQVDATASS